MASPTEPISHFLQSATSNFLSLFTPSPKTSSSSSSSLTTSKICVPLLHPIPNYSPFDSNPKSSSIKTVQSPTSTSNSNSPFPSTVRINSLNSNGKAGGPAFVGQVFSMCDLSGTGLMAVSTHFDIPFLSNRLNIPSGVVGACRLDLAYEHFKEKPHLFQFVPNEKQVKAANKLLKIIQQNGGSKKVDGVPVFSAQNLDIAIATTDGIKWYTPYFFDKNMLDNILEESVDQHFHSLIQTRHMQRRRDVVDDNLAAEVIEEMGDSLWEPPEVQELLDEMGHPGIPLSVISKAAEMQLLYTVDRVILGNRWLRRATGIQPKFPYMVDSFEKRSAASVLRAYESSVCVANSETENDSKDSQHQGMSELALKDNIQANQEHNFDLRLPFGDLLSQLWSKKSCQTEELSRECIKQNLQPNPFLPKITMVGISTGEAGQMSKASIKKTMEDLTKELEQTDQGSAIGSSNEFKNEDRDPLFVANVGDYYSGLAKTGSARWIRGRNN
uniref:Tic22-like family protein n=2 Tax=Fagus sylvatica TaxID=28930 RepID=A0A2N9FDN7_FAGSY